MPELSRFLGIAVFIYFNDSNPSCFHMEYDNHQASIAIENLSVLEGGLPY